MFQSGADPRILRLRQVHGRVPPKPRGAWLLPLVLSVLALGLVALLGAPGVGERVGPPAEDLVVDRLVLRPGTVELSLRNDGADPVSVAQVIVNDAIAQFTGPAGSVDPLRAGRFTIAYPWSEGEVLDIALLTSTGGTITHQVPIAVARDTSAAELSGNALMIGVYAGVLPVLLGLAWLPVLRRLSTTRLRFVLAATLGMLGMIVVETVLEGLEVASQGSQAWGGPVLFVLALVITFLALQILDEALPASARARDGFLPPYVLASGIGLHNLGEGVLLGAAFAHGSIALGTFLILGFAVHNVTEGLAIASVAARLRHSLGHALLLALIAGGPIVAGIWIGAQSTAPAMTALLFGVGAGALVSVLAQIAPAARNVHGKLLDLSTSSGIMVGALLLFATGLLVRL